MGIVSQIKDLDNSSARTRSFINTNAEKLVICRSFFQTRCKEFKPLRISEAAFLFDRKLQQAVKLFIYKDKLYKLYYCGNICQIKKYL